VADRAQLEAAAAAGIITSEQAEQVLAFVRARTPAPAAASSGEEDLRFIRNFHDVFLAIGVVLLAIGMGIAAGITLYNISDFKSAKPSGAMFLLFALIAAIPGGVLWALAEVFSRRRRLFLPSIAICVTFTAFVIASAVFVYLGFVAQVFAQEAARMQPDLPLMRWGLLWAALFSALAPAAFYWRFRLPFSLGMVGTGLALVAAAFLYLIAPHAFLSSLYPLMLIVGLALFAAGVGFDVRDPSRATRFSDNGFWLHMAAAPLILNGALGCVANIIAPGAWSGIAALTAEGKGAMLAAANLVIVVSLGLVSLLINRRALIVSALLTAGISVGVLLNSAGLSAASLAAGTLLTLGAFVLILGAGWHKARALLLQRVPRSGLMARIFPSEVLE
jgi:hypothetical protein